jgi:hypothetical protein
MALSWSTYSNCSKPLNSPVKIDRFIETKDDGTLFTVPDQPNPRRNAMFIFGRPWIAPVTGLVTALVVVVLLG